MKSQAVDRGVREIVRPVHPLTAVPNPNTGISEAYDLYRRADFAACFAALAATDGVEAAILRARMHLASDRVTEAIEALETASVVAQTAPIDLAGTYWTLALAARRRRGDEPHALREALTNAAGYALSAATVAVRAEWYFYEARHALALGDLKNARAHAAHAFLDASIGRGRVYGLLAELDAADGNAAGRRANVIDGLTFVRERERYGERDAFLAAVLLGHLGRILGEHHAPAVFTFFSGSVEALAWTNDLHAHRYYVDRAFATEAVLRGDRAEAFLRLSHASAIAPTSILAIHAHVERERLAVDVAEPYFARECLARAAHLAESIVWEDRDGDELAALVDLAEGFALVQDGPRARAYLDRYERTRNSGLRRTGMIAREELEARERMAFGLTAILFEGPQAGCYALEAAYRTWFERGNLCAAARTANVLARITSEERWPKASAQIAALLAATRDSSVVL